MIQARFDFNPLLRAQGGETFLAVIESSSVILSTISVSRDLWAMDTKALAEPDRRSVHF
ncbi:hypothetical protein NF681_19845 (plasmid) [Comamonadaceae bacterium OTU4NAUVB1]|nr:hypothetical protein NF681_19845 [Comamonadaceae bacterium OTU4NAUVB1]